MTIQIPEGYRPPPLHSDNKQTDSLSIASKSFKGKTPQETSSASHVFEGVQGLSLTVPEEQMDNSVEKKTLTFQELTDYITQNNELKQTIHRTLDITPLEKNNILLVNLRNFLMNTHSLNRDNADGRILKVGNAIYIAAAKEYGVPNYSPAIIGQGSFGEVSMLRNIRGDQEFAMKHVSLVDRKGQSALHKETRLMTILANGRESDPSENKETGSTKTKSSSYFPNIHAYAQEAYSGYYDGYIIMDKVGERALSSENTSLTYTKLIQLSNAIQEMHQKGVAHLDLKEENIREDTAGNIWIIDPGMSEDLIDRRFFESTIKGTPEYLAIDSSPDKISPITVTPDNGPFCDLYAYAIIILKLLDGSDDVNISTPEFYEAEYSNRYTNWSENFQNLSFFEKHRVIHDMHKSKLSKSKHIDQELKNILTLIMDQTDFDFEKNFETQDSQPNKPFTQNHKKVQHILQRLKLKLELLASNKTWVPIKK